MSESVQSPALPGTAFALPVLPSAVIEVVAGANFGDALSFAADLIPDDVYSLLRGARTRRLLLHPDGPARFRVAQTTDVGQPGALVHLDCCLTFMSTDGGTTEVLVLVEVDASGDVVEVHALPLVPLTPKTRYTLVTIDTEGASARLAEIACVSFTRGTHITLASGEQRLIEDLRPGDRVLTRDDGPQDIRWIGQTTLRAYGEHAPIVITAGTLHNANDLIVSPDHRLFIYQRADVLGAGRAEVLVRARHLVNGTTVYHQPGGYVDYFQILFDRHQIIYAEGIAAETLLLDPRTRPVLPTDLSEKLGDTLGKLHAAGIEEFEVSERLLDLPNAADILRRASLG
ncbi:MAG: Hint domain-containing protein [Paracoccaceae bacterium]|uniref:Hint domain-containing protein n=1 Tax=Seohaeicola saemankumensis TaxID=481181 RepID=UPI001E2B2CE4|nr:Hint domain-containing protein [Seohaeicola saemankumensis]MCD1626374.1 Hint domain-containing protein [Seohaeicola saemankumensis]